MNSELPELEPYAAQATRARTAWRALGLRIGGITPRQLLRGLLVLGCLLLIGWLIQTSWSVLTPFIFGLVLAYLLLPLTHQLQRVMPRWLAVLCSLLIAALVFGGAVALILPPFISQLNGLIAALPTSAAKADEYVRYFNQLYQSLAPAQQQVISDYVNQLIGVARDNALSYGQSMVAFLLSGVFTVFSLLGTIIGLLILPFFVYYVMKDQAEGRRALDRMLPDWLQGDFWALVRIVDSNLNSYIRGQLLLSCVTALLTFLSLGGLAIAGIPVSYGVLIAVLAGVTELIPYVGFVIAVLAALGVGALTSWQAALWMALVVFVVKQIAGVFFYPLIVGRSVRIHEAVILVVLVVLSEFGFIWVILAPPVAGVARDLFRYAYGRLSDPPSPPGLLPEPPEPSPRVVPRSARLKRR